MTEHIDAYNLPDSVPGYVKARLAYLEDYIQKYPQDLTQEVYEIYNTYTPQKIQELEVRAAYCDELLTRIELLKSEANNNWSGQFVYRPPEILLNPRHGLAIPKYPSVNAGDIRYWLFDFETAIRTRYPEILDIQLCHWVFYWIKNESGIENECISLLQMRTQTNWEETKSCLIQLESQFPTHYLFEQNVYANMEKLNTSDPSFFSKMAYYSTLFRSQSRIYPTVRGILVAKYISHPKGRIIQAMAYRFENEVSPENRTGKRFIEYLRPDTNRHFKSQRKQLSLPKKKVCIA